MKIVSLIPSSTEIVAALGFEKNLVGRSHECDYPLSVKQLPICTQPKFNPEGSSYEINERVKAILQDSLSVYRVEAELLGKLEPDVIVTQTQCEVCAVSLKDVEAAVCEFVKSHPKIVPLEPNSLADVWNDIEKVGRALGVEKRAKEIVQSYQERMQLISERTKGLKRPRVACIEWIDPLMAAGNWIPTLVEMAGGVNLFGNAGEHSPWMKWEDLVNADPDIIVMMPCGFDIPKTTKEAEILYKKAEWKTLAAVRNNKVFFVDGNQYFNRPGPRLVESLEILADIFRA